MNKIISLTVSLLLVLFIACSNGSGDVASGSGTGTGNPIIIGVAYFEDNKPAANSEVTVRKTGVTAENSDISYLGDEFDSTGKIFTNDEGEYRFTLTDTGDFTIHVTSGTQSVSTEIAVKDSLTLMVDTTTLVEMDTIRGEIHYLGGDETSAMIYVEGTADSIKVASDGSFIVPVSVGVYTIHIVPESDDYERWVGNDLVSDTTLSRIEIVTKYPTMDTIRGTIHYFGGGETSAMVHVEGSNDSIKVGSNGSFVVPVPAGVYALNIVPESDQYRSWTGTNIVSDTTLTPMKILAKEPVSTDYVCDSLIVRAFLDSNSLFDILVSQITVTVAGRIVELDTKPDVQDSLSHDISPDVTVVPTEIGGLSALKELEIQYTKVTELPSSIGNLTLLEELELNGNDLISLPSSIGELSNLVELTLQFNNLTILPESFTNLTPTKMLSIQYNNLSLTGELKLWAETYAPGWEQLIQK